MKRRAVIAGLAWAGALGWIVVAAFEDMLTRAPRGDGQWGRIGESVYDTIRRELAGRDLACWCPLDQPCHADVLLEIANGGAV